MASVKRRLAANVLGNFYVDASCIECGTCRGIAPAADMQAKSREWIAGLG